MDDQSEDGNSKQMSLSQMGHKNKHSHRLYNHHGHRSADYESLAHKRAHQKQQVQEEEEDREEEESDD